MRGTTYISFNNLNRREFIFKLNIYLIGDTSNAIKFLCTQIRSWNKKSLKNTSSLLSNEILKLPCHFKFIQWCRVALDSIESKKSYKPELRKIKKKLTENICRFAFNNNAIEMINFPSIFNIINVKSILVISKCIL